MKALFAGIIAVVLGVAVMPSLGLAAWSLSQSSVTVNVGQSTTVYAYGVANWLYISNNTNGSVANVSVSGGQVTVTGNTVGSTSITLCDQNGQGGCASLYVTVNSYGGNQSLSFSQTNVYLSNGQSGSVSVYGGSGTYYISSNSNSSVVDTSVSGSTIWLTPRSQSGTATITVCSSSGSSGCGTFSVTVNSSNTYGYGTVSFSNTNPTLSVGQNLVVTINGNGYGSYYLSSTANNIVQASVSGNTLTLYGVAPGSVTVSVCSSSSGSGCASLYATVSGYYNNYYNGGYNSGTGYNYGYQTNTNLLAQIQSLEAMLAQLKAQALAYNGSSYSGIYGQVLGQTSYVFYSTLGLGSSGSEVTALQQYLKNRSIYSGPITGYYWTLTSAAVRQYQSLRGLSVTGVVDAQTRTALNAGY